MDWNIGIRVSLHLHSENHLHLSVESHLPERLLGSETEISTENKIRDYVVRYEKEGITRK